MCASQLDIRVRVQDALRRQHIQTIAKALEIAWGKEQPGNYPPVTPGMFADGKIPTDPDGGNYIGLPTTFVPTYQICAKLESRSPSEYCLKDQSH